jgi:hypothetical protein
LDFGGVVSLTQLQFISHQSKIASNIILSSARDAAGWKTANFQQIDTFQFTDNRQREYKAREVRCANLPNLKARFLKLQIDRIHHNRLNPSNQVGIVSISAAGVLDISDTDDPELIRLEREKRAAISSENFALAQQLKSRISNYRENRSRLLDLNRRKEDAVRHEDFALADRIKQQIAKIEIGEEASDILRRSANASEVLGSGQSVRSSSGRFSGDSRRPKASFGSDAAYDVDLPLPSQEYMAVEPEPVLSARREPYQDERPIKPGPHGQYVWNEKDNVNADDEIVKSSDDRHRKPAKRKQNAAPSRRRQQDDANNLIEFGDSQPGDPEQPEPLDDRGRQECELFISLFGEEPVRYFYSRMAGFRVRGIKELSEGIRGCRSSQHSQLFPRFCDVMRGSLREKGIGVFVAATEELTRLADELRLSSDVVRTSIESLLGEIVKRLGDQKKQISQAAKEFIMWAAEKDALGVGSIAPHLMAPLKQAVIWANVQEKLNVIRELLEAFGLVDASFDAAVIIDYVFVTLMSKNSDVRSSACRVCKVLAKMGFGVQINKMLQASSLSAATQNAVRAAISR